jgi:transcriptional regulator with XRE-family HTH domain
VDENDVVGKVVERLRDIREEKGVSRYRLSKETGLSTSGIRHMEQGEVTPTLYFLLRIASFLEVDLAMVLSEAGREKPKRAPGQRGAQLAGVRHDSLGGPGAPRYRREIRRSRGTCREWRRVRPRRGTKLRPAMTTILQQPLSGVLKSSGRESSPSQDERQFFEEFLGRHLARLAEAYPLDEIDAPLSSQDVADRGLAHVHLPGELLLGQSRVRPDTGHHLQHGFLIGGVDRLCSHREKLASPAHYRKCWPFIAFSVSRAAVPASSRKFHLKGIDVPEILSKLRPVMKSQPFALTLLAGILPVVAQEPEPKWDVEIPPPVVVEVPAKPTLEPEPIEFEVLSSRTKEVFVSEAAEMPDLPPVEGSIKMTIQRVADPGLPDPPPPLPVLPPDDRAVLARLAELRETYRGTELVFLSASVHLNDAGSEEARTLLRIYPNGQVGEEVVAWSNVNFLHLTGQGGYRVNHSDGTHQNMGLLMGISPMYGQTMRRLAEKAGRDYQEPEIPNLPDLTKAGPAFVAVDGYADSPAMDVLQQLHELFKKSGDTLRDQYLAREKARAERKAYLLANPEKPKDVTIRVWRRTPTQDATEETR